MSKTYLQEKITGTQGQVVGFDASGNAVAQVMPPICYSKDETLTAATAALYGLTNAVPDDVFAYLGKYAEHYWKRRTHTFSYSEKKTELTTNDRIANTTITVRYSSSVVCDSSGVSLNNPTEVSIESNVTGMAKLVSYAPCYFSTPIDRYEKIYYLPIGSTSGTTFSATAYSSSGTASLSGNSQAAVRASVVTLETTESIGEWELLSSTNRSAYPDSGIVDGYEYQYIGVPFEKLPTAPQIETGSYVGTGTYGESNPNSITFGLVPKFVMVWCDAESSPTYTFGIMNTLSVGVGSLRNNNAGYFRSGTGSTSGTTRDSVSRIDGNTIYWYTTTSDAYNQLNDNNITYYYLAIG